jgi:hypothetical protein
VSGYRLHEEGTAAATIGQQPTPEVGTLPGAPDRPASTTNEREIQEDDRVRSAEPDIDDVVWSEIAVENPSLFRNKLVLHRHPLIPRRSGKAWPPENLVQFDDRDGRDVGQLDRKGRLS